PARLVAIGHEGGARREFGGQLVEDDFRGDDLRMLPEHGAQRIGVEMVAVMVGEDDQGGVGQPGEAFAAAHRIAEDRLAVPFHDEGRVVDGDDDQRPGGGLIGVARIHRLSSLGSAVEGICGNDVAPGAVMSSPAGNLKTRCCGSLAAMLYSADPTTSAAPNSPWAATSRRRGAGVVERGGLENR